MVPFEMQVLRRCLNDDEVLLDMNGNLVINEDKLKEDTRGVKKRFHQIMSFVDVMSDVIDNDRCNDIIKTVKEVPSTEFDKLITTDDVYDNLFVKILEQKQKMFESGNFSDNAVDCNSGVPKFLRSERELFDVIKTEPTDRFIFDESVRTFLLEKCLEADKLFVPVKNIVTGRFQLHDCEIALKKKIQLPDGETKEVEFLSRVYIHDTIPYEWINRELDDNVAVSNLYHVGYLDIHVPELENTGLLVALIAFKGYDNFLYFPTIMPYGFEGHENELFDFYSVTTRDITTLVTKHLQTWFAVEWFCMICPSFLKDGRRVKDRRKRMSGKKLSSATRRINYHYWTKESMEKIMSEHLAMIEKTGESDSNDNDEKRA